MMADFVLRALLAGLLVASIAGPLGCFVVWRRMAYFGDALAHSALLGIALGLLLDLNLQLAVLLGCFLLALLLALAENRRDLSTDAILGILAHSALAFGLVILSFSDAQINLTGYLFGDLLTVTAADLWWIGAGSLAVLGLLIWNWKPLLAITLHQELAQVEGVNVSRARLALMLMIATMVAISMKIVGVLLITSLLIIPPACARPFVKTPELMALSASLIGCLAVCGGLGASYAWDTPAGASIVACAALLFMLSSLSKVGRA